MLNIKTLTDTLSRMQLPQLQQYATLHKNDPYIVTLALSIANQKKQMQAGQAGRAGMQPQPKVADQQIAQMAAPQQEAPTVDAMGNVTGYAGGGYLPEDSGIGTLPAPNMQNFAGGGIVAFDDGGSVRHFDGSRGSFVGTSNAVPPGAIIMGNMYQDPNTGEMKPLPGVEFKPLTQEQRNLGTAKLIPSLSEVADFFRTPYGKKQAAIQRGNETREAQNKALVERYKPLRSDDQQFESEVAKRNNVIDPTATTVNTPRAGNVSATNPAAKPPVADVAKPPTTPVDPLAGITALNTKAMTTAEAKAEAKKLSDSSRLESELKSNETFTTQAYEKLLGDYDKNIAKMPEAYKGYEARLKKEEDAASTDKDKALGMAIFQAGLGMMGGTSQYAFENISKGALSGLDNYQSALKDLKKAQRERDKAFADIEAARSAEKRGDLRTQTELQAKGIEALGAAKNRTVEGIAKIFQVDTETAKGLFDTKFKEASQNERTIFTTKADLQKQSMSDAAAMERTNAQVAGSLATTRMNADAFKLPMLYKSVEDSVDKMLQADMNYKTADEVTKTAMRNAALQKRLLATPGLAQYADATTGGGSAPGLRYNPQTGKIE